MKLRMLLFGGLTLALLSSQVGSARAHFVWLVVTTQSDGSHRLELRFSEAGEAGESHLVERVTGADVWVLDVKGERSTLKLQRESESSRALAALLPAQVSSAAAECLYGVLDKGGGNPFDLRYYARYARADEAGFESLSLAEPLPLDLTAVATENGCRLQVRHLGKRLPGAELVVVDSRNKEHLFESDARGEVELDSLTAGIYSARTKLVEAVRGERAGKSYEEVRHYATLTLEVTSEQAASEPSASQLLGRARDQRAVWFEFPGFTAEMRLFSENRWCSAKLRVSGGGKVAIEGCENENVRQTLESLVAHRLPGGNDNDGVSYVKEAEAHPLGRLVKLEYDTAMGSTYRLHENVVRQVNREAGGGKFTISVLNVHRNAEGKYLPATYAVSFWNRDGSLRSSSTTTNTWLRLGRYDLPASVFQVTSGEDKLDYLQIEFSKHQLLSTEAEAR